MLADPRGRRAALLLWLIVVAAPELWQTEILVREVQGVNSFDTHRPFFADKTIGQVLRWPRANISAVGVWLGRYRRAAEPTGDVFLRIREADGEQRLLREARVPVRDIRFGTATRFRFQPLPAAAGRTLAIELRAPETVSAAALAARIDPNPAAEPTGALLLSGSPQAKDLAFQLFHRGGRWSQLAVVLARDRDLRVFAGAAVAAGALLVVLAEFIRAGSRRREVAVVLLLLLGFCTVRLMLARQFEAVPQGDPYNYAFIVQRLLRGENPYAEEKRLPGYPLAVLPLVWFRADPLAAGILVNQVALTVAVGACYLLARRCALSPGGALLAAGAFAASRDVFFVSFHPLSYTLFTAQALVTLLLLPWVRQSPRRAVVFGILLGWAAQTRHEGLVLAPLALALLAVRAFRVWRRGARVRIPRLLLPTAVAGGVSLLLLLPLPLHNLRAYGNPFYSAYLDLPATNVRKSPSEVRQNLGLAWSVVSSTWWPYWRHEIRFPFDGTAAATAGVLLAGAAVAVALRRPAAAPIRSHVATGLAAAGILGGLGVILAAARDQTAVFSSAVRALVLLSVLGWGALLWRVRASRPLALVGLLLAAATSWAHPAGKNFLHVVPFLAFGAAAGLDRLLPLSPRDRHEAVASAVLRALLVAALALPTVRLFDHLPGAIEQFNQKHADDTLARIAARVLPAHVPDGLVAVQHFRLPFYLFLDGGRVRERLPGNASSLMAWLADHDIRAIIEYSSDTAFAGIRESPERFPVLYEMARRKTGGALQTIRIIGVRSLD